MDGLRATDFTDWLVGNAYDIITSMQRIRNPEEKRRRILDAALEILREGDYLTKFSLDSVAKKAGVSKGGLTHHFPSKESLLTGVAKMMIDEFEARVHEGMAKEPEGMPGRILRSYIRAVLSDEGEQLARISPVLLSYTGGIHGLGSRFDYWHEMISADGIDPVIAAMIRLAVDGLLYTEMIDGQPIVRALRREIFERLLEDATV